MVKQRLHATHNLMELLSAKHRGIPPTLRDDRLDEEVIHKYIYYTVRMYLFFFFLNQSCVLRITTAVFSFSVSL